MIHTQAKENPAFVLSEEDVVKTNERAYIQAVEMKDASVTFGKGKHIVQALQNVSLNVPKGVIYALLGPSGCGKTTLLRTLVGLTRLKEGSAKAFGKSVGSPDCGIPGSWVGYMPQELSLYGELSVEEILSFFGELQHMPSQLLKERIKFLVKLLDMTSCSGKQVNQLSGGQKRRLSLAAALVHNPPLVLLDEPTVGVDPLLRVTIWDHLIRLSKDPGMTIIITTHYIEEARNANMVGLLREGRLLKEGEPYQLIAELGTRTLEEAFLKLCENDEKSIEALDSATDVDEIEEKTSVNSIETNLASSSTSQSISMPFSERGSEKEKSKHLPYSDMKLPELNKSNQHFFMLVYVFVLKNLRILRRNFIFLIIAFASPFGNVFMVKLLYGHTPYGLPIAVANLDTPPVFSNLFLDRIDKDVIYYKNHSSLESAINAVKNGEAWGALYFPRKYTTSSVHRNRLGFDADNISAYGSLASLYMDKTNVEITRTIYISLLDSMTGLAKEHIINLGDNPAAIDSPIIFEDPIYGTMKTEFTDFTLFNFLPDSMFFMSMGLAALTFVEERNNGLFDRSSVSGLTISQVLLAHICIQSIVSVAAACGLVIFLVAFQIESVGSLALVGFLCYLQGNVGMSVGVFVSSMTNKAYAALYVVTAIYQCNLMTSGCWWPVEALPYWLRPVSYVGPDTLMILAVREIINRGFDWTNQWVWAAVSISFVWTLLPLLAAILVFRIFK